MRRAPSPLCNPANARGGGLRAATPLCGHELNRSGGIPVAEGRSLGDEHIVPANTSGRDLPGISSRRTLLTTCCRHLAGRLRLPTCRHDAGRTLQIPAIRSRAWTACAHGPAFRPHRQASWQHGRTIQRISEELVRTSRRCGCASERPGDASRLLGCTSKRPDMRTHTLAAPPAHSRVLRCPSLPCPICSNNTLNPN